MATVRVITDLERIGRPTGAHAHQRRHLACNRYHQQPLPTRHDDGTRTYPTSSSSTSPHLVRWPRRPLRQGRDTLRQHQPEQERLRHTATRFTIIGQSTGADSDLIGAVAAVLTNQGITSDVRQSTPTPLHLARRMDSTHPTTPHARATRTARTPHQPKWKKTRPPEREATVRPDGFALDDSPGPTPLVVKVKGTAASVDPNTVIASYAAAQSCSRRSRLPRSPASHRQTAHDTRHPRSRKAESTCPAPPAPARSVPVDALLARCPAPWRKLNWSAACCCSP
ncbi:DUF3893 domain-containing protein [Streptacidiphilus sp. 4-A2]|nr:DUF3893 domain-containing protein [Streptacidiphilus sp. 4-A2]